MKQTLPELSPETLAAVRISALCADTLVAEADAVRARDRQAMLDQHCRDGYHDYWAHKFTPEFARRLAENTIFHYPRPRRAKMLRAHLRRYERLKSLYEQIHPPFTHPEFPEDPRMEMWRESVATLTGGWTVGVASTTLSLRVYSHQPTTRSPPLSIRSPFPRRSYT
ncbi:hypothetical protein C8R46DRAFT_1205594 [Mycena filopes]|nr:hypothetical protein C8R46DRAFT_1205594 [Mycena filopes]